jgi:hypothetical protein
MSISTLLLILLLTFGIGCLLDRLARLLPAHPRTVQARNGRSANFRWECNRTDIT